MARKFRNLSEYKGMWLFSLFDLPVTTAAARKNYTKFRKALLKRGFDMVQFSVYAKYCSDEARGKTLMQLLKKDVPPQGQVRFLLVTDRQFGKMVVFQGKKREEPEKPPDQLMLF